MAEHCNLYDRASYYDVIFDRDVTSEIGFVRDVYRHFAGGEVNSVIDVACGPGYHARAFGRDGVRALGLDLRGEMLHFAADKAAKEGAAVEWLEADMRTFKLDRPVDVAFCMFDGLDCLLSNDSLTAHFAAVAANLTPAGLYIVDLSHPAEVSFEHYKKFHYRGSRDGVQVDIYWATNDPHYDLATGVAHVALEMHVDDHGKRFVVKDEADERLLFPQEIALLAAASAAPWSSRPPNILWLQVDSLDGRLIDPTSPYYDKLLVKGFKDLFVGGGTSFVRHYTNSPQCVPSRTSMMTGRYAHEMDTTNNGQGLARSTKTGKLDSGCVAAWNATSCAAFAALQNQSYTMLDLLAGELVESDWNVKRVLETICSSEAYGAATPAVTGQPHGRDYVFKGPLPRRMTAEQFTDAVWQLTATAPVKADAELLRFDPPPGVEPPRPTAVWIWSNELADSPPGEKLTFRRRFTLPAGVVHAIAVFTADNEATLFVNGKQAARCAEWTQPVQELLTADLRQGDNDVTVTAANGAAGGLAALSVEIRAVCADGSRHTIATDERWQWTAAAPGANGTFPKDKEPIDWAPAAVVKTQSTWNASLARFTDQLLAAVAPDAMPMVRAALVKGTSLMASLGRPNRDQVVTSRPTDLTTLEAIQLANEQTLADEFSRGGKAILTQHGPAADTLVPWMFEAALGRPPTTAEAVAARDLLGATPTAETVADCLWALVMLPDFQLIR